eukprot:g2479.t1
MLQKHKTLIQQKSFACMSHMDQFDYVELSSASYLDHQRDCYTHRQGFCHVQLARAAFFSEDSDESLPSGALSMAFLLNESFPSRASSISLLLFVFSCLVSCSPSCASSISFLLFVFPSLGTCSPSSACAFFSFFLAGHMDQFDYVELSSASYGHKKAYRALMATMGLGVLSWAGWVCTMGFRHKAPSARFRPRRGVEQVVARPGPPLLPLPSLSAGPSCLFVYSHGEAWSQIAAHAQSVEEAVVYGASCDAGRGGHAQWATITGEPGDIVRGRVLCWRDREGLPSQAQVALSNFTRPGRGARSSMVHAVLADGQCRLAHWLHAAPPTTADLSLRADFRPPWYLQSGLAMTLYIALRAKHTWPTTLTLPPVPYTDHIFQGHGGVPIFGRWAVPPPGLLAGAPGKPRRGTVIATYGITGTLENQWMLGILARKAYHRGLGVVVFDWRGHGRTADLSPTLTSDGIFEGQDYVELARAAKRLGLPAPFWFVGYSLGGQLALWAAKAAMDLPAGPAELSQHDIGGVAAVCPSLDAARSLRHLMTDPMGRLLEQAITKELKRLVGRIQAAHPGQIDPAAVARADSIWAFDRELVVPTLGYASVEEYYAASSPLSFLPTLSTPSLILYAADDPMFAPQLVEELHALAKLNPRLDLLLTQYGGHVGYVSSGAGQALSSDQDPWWAWNRVLDWIEVRLETRPK